MTKLHNKLIKIIYIIDFRNQIILVAKLHNKLRKTIVSTIYIFTT